MVIVRDIPKLQRISVERGMQKRLLKGRQIIWENESKSIACRVKIVIC